MVESLRVAFPGLGDCLLSEDMAGSTMVESLRVALPGLGDCLLSEDVAGEREGVGVAPPRMRGSDVLFGVGRRLATRERPLGVGLRFRACLATQNAVCSTLASGFMCAWPHGTRFVAPRFVVRVCLATRNAIRSTLV